MKDDYQLIESTINYLDNHFREHPSLNDLAVKFGVSPSHFQKVFKRWAGVSPKQFIDLLTLQYSKNLLENNASLLNAAWDSGLSGPSRLHDLFVNLHAMTPGQYKKMGAGLCIHYGFHATPFGHSLLAATERGICSLFFISEKEKAAALQDLKKTWPLSKLNFNPQVTQPFVDTIFKKRATLNKMNPERLNLVVKATHLQSQVWQALLQIPEGSLCSYQDVAAKVGHPTATRAVASAIGANLISYIIPCHRVLRKTGAIGGYRWGINRKRAMLAWESIRT